MSVLFALVDNKDDANSFEYFASKRVARENIYHIGYLQKLAEKISPSDTLMVIDVNRFGSVRVFQNFFYFAKKNNINFKSLANPYLSFNDSRETKQSYVEFLSYMAKMEVKLIRDISTLESAKNNPSISGYISAMCIDILGQVFSSNSVIKRS